MNSNSYKTLNYRKEMITMKVATTALLLIVATVLMTVSLLASVLAPPTALDSRDALVLSLGIAGLSFGVLAVRRLVSAHQLLFRAPQGRF